MGQREKKIQDFLGTKLERLSQFFPARGYHPCDFVDRLTEKV